MRFWFAAAFALLPATAAAQVRPDASWRQIESQHFRVVYEAGLDSIARHAAARAELEHAKLSATLIRAPAGRIDIIIADNSDLTNGLARPFPSNRIVIWARPPVEELTLANYTDWIDLVIAHELTHVFQHDQAGRAGRALRTAFGRIPWAWPVFPTIGIPRWNSEGLATVIESEHTGAGRVYGSYHEMVVRTAILENDFPSIDRVSGETPIWPGGNRAYIYGSLFMAYITQHHGEKAQTELIRKTAGSILPPPWRMNAIAKKALGRSYSDLYRDWRTELGRTYAALADSLRAAGLTQTERITTAGRIALHPRISADNRLLAYADENGRDVTATRVMDLSTRADERYRRNGAGPLAWLPDNTGFVTAQYDFVGTHEIYSDLWLVRKGAETRLTRGVRAETPDVSRDGKRIVYVQNVRGSNRLVVRDLDDGEERVIVERSPDVHWILPRWSPDGSRIAVQRWARGRGHDFAILDAAGAVTDVVSTSGLDTAPTWSPDGRHIIFASDRTGIANLYAYDTRSAEMRQVTNLLTGAFYPEVSPDGRWIYFSAYHADGFHIERIAYDPAAWRISGAARSRAPQRVDPTPPIMLTPSRAYSPVPSLLPKFWLPYFVGDTVIGQYIGVFSAGEDDVGRHSYFASLEYSPETQRSAGEISYAWAGLGNPVLTMSAARIWDNLGLRAIRNEQGVIVDTLNAYEREDRIAVAATIAHRRWRHSASLMLGMEGVQFSRHLAGNATFTDPRDKLVGVLGGAAFSTVRSPTLSISLEDGVRGSMLARRRFEIDPAPGRDESYTELSGVASAYKSVGGSGFAHNVVAARTSAVYRSALGPGPTDVGGLLDFLPVRGFDEDERIGFRAWTASLEYRMPLALVGRGIGLFPLFVDRVAGALFLDAGNAFCDAEQRSVYLSCAGAGSESAETLVSAGFELNANVSMLAFLPSWIRGGLAFQLAGTEKKQARFYVTVGPAF